MVNANAIGGKDVFVVLSVAGAYGGLARLLAGMWAERNTFAGGRVRVLRRPLGSRSFCWSSSSCRRLHLGLLGGGHSTIMDWGGYVTIASAVVAWYAVAVATGDEPAR